MLQMIVFLLIVLCVAFGFSWLSDQPGSILINFAGYERLFTPVEFVISLILILTAALSVWIFIQRVIGLPAFLANTFKQRREKRGLEALSAGLIAVGVGDRIASGRYAIQARKSLPNEPLTALLRAQSAQLIGDRSTARRIYESMLEAPDTEILGLRGLFLEAQQEREDEAAYQYAERAVELNPRLQWSVNAVFDYQCKRGDWAGALETLEVVRQHKHMERSVVSRRKAVLLTAQARDLEDDDMDKALELALEAHGLAVDLAPAADIAGRILASKGNTGRAAKVVAKTWKKSPHPDLALTYAYARPGDSPRDRLQRVKSLAAMAPGNVEGPMAVALAAIEAKEWEQAIDALVSLVAHEPSARVCTLMARIEGERGDQGRMREWLARAVRAPRDAVWAADGFVSDRWMPVSPVTGELDCFEWKAPVETVGAPSSKRQDDLLPLEMVTAPLHQSSVEEGDIDEPEEEVVVVSASKVEEEKTVDAKVEHPAAEVRKSDEESDRKAKQETDAKSLVVVEQEEDAVVQFEKRSEPVAQNADLKGESKASDAYAAASKQASYEQRRVNEPKMYVAPRAPDDPGIGPYDGD